MTSARIIQVHLVTVLLAMKGTLFTMGGVWCLPHSLLQTMTLTASNYRVQLVLPAQMDTSCLQIILALWLTLSAKQATWQLDSVQHAILAILCQWVVA